jgi:hypothetical protein
MTDYVCLMIWVYYEAAGDVLECALKVKRSMLPGDCEKCPMEPENRAILHDMLPEHVRSAGPICRVEYIFEIYEVPDLAAAEARP